MGINNSKVNVEVLSDGSTVYNISFVHNGIFFFGTIHPSENDKPIENTPMRSIRAITFTREPMAP